MLFSEKSESDISKADFNEKKSSHRIDEEEDDAESFIPCAQASPQKESKTEHEETKASEPGDEKNSTASDTVKEFKNSERGKRVPFTPEEDSFIGKGIKKHGFGQWTAILRSFNSIRPGLFSRSPGQRGTQRPGCQKSRLTSTHQNETLHESL